jgi:hypothetical protein
MMVHALRETNHLAVVGFMLPFAAAGMTALLVLLVPEVHASPAFMLPYLTLVPLVLVCGLVCAIKSIPLIEERNDKDYAYSGLILSILFILIYVLSLIYFFASLPN